MKKVLLLITCVAIVAMVPACKKLSCQKQETMQEAPAAPTMPAPEAPAMPEQAPAA